MEKKKPVVLIIIDGFGVSRQEKGNAVLAAKTPNFDEICANNPTTTIGASGSAVGLPEGQVGNSEVGHTNLGTGRVIYQDIVRINDAIKDGSIYNNEAFVKAVNNCKEHNSALQIIGLLSDGGVHSHVNHLYGLLELAKKHGINKVFIHIFTDGRDVLITSAKGYFKELNEKIAEIGVGKVATITGRYYALDRDNRWERIEKAYNILVNGVGERANNEMEVLEKAYAEGKTDEFVEPTVLIEDSMIKENDSVIFFNFRPDRARELTRALTEPDFDKFERQKGWFKTCFVCMTQFDETLKNVEIAFKEKQVENAFGEYISKKGLTQLRIAETEKYAHVTFFFNGGEEKKFEGEDRILIDSPKVATYDEKPEMSAEEIKDNTINRLNLGIYDSIVLNFANCDMVGHTGEFEATVKAIEYVDKCLKEVVDAVIKVGGVAIVTADHGNSEKMLSEDDQKFTAHTTNPVVFSVIGYDCKLKEGGKLADVAPTMLEILGLEKPSEMTGESLIQH